MTGGDDGMSEANDWTCRGAEAEGWEDWGGAAWLRMITGAGEVEYARAVTRPGGSAGADWGGV